VKLEPSLHPLAIVELVEVSELPSAFPYWTRVEAIRTSSAWRQHQAASNPASRPNYNAIVMMKYETAPCVLQLASHLVAAGCSGCGPSLAQIPSALHFSCG